MADHSGIRIGDRYSVESIDDGFYDVEVVDLFPLRNWNCVRVRIVSRHGGFAQYYGRELNIEALSLIAISKQEAA